MSEHEPESPGDSGTDLRHDSHTELGGHKDTSDDQSDAEAEEGAGAGRGAGPTIGIRSDLLPMHPVPKEGLQGAAGALEGLHGLPALEALRRQAGAQVTSPDYSQHLDSRIISLLEQNI